MTTHMSYVTSGATLPCDGCGLQTRMHSILKSGDGEAYETEQYRNPRTKKDRNARYCEPCAKEKCGIFPLVSYTQARKAMEVLGREKDAKSEFAGLEKEAKDAKETVLRYLVQNDADQLAHGGHTAKFRTRTSSSFDKDFLEEFLTEEQLKQATKTTESQFVQVS